MKKLFILIVFSTLISSCSISYKYYLINSLDSNVSIQVFFRNRFLKSKAGFNYSKWNHKKPRYTSHKSFDSVIEGDVKEGQILELIIPSNTIAFIDIGSKFGSTYEKIVIERNGVKEIINANSDFSKNGKAIWYEIK